MNIILALLILAGAASAASWYNDTSWNYSQAITVDPQFGGAYTTNLTWFPAKVSINTSNTTLWGATCKNVRFSDETNTTTLNYELDADGFCGNTSVNSTFWVSMPNLSYATTRIYAYLGNTAASDGSNITQVWRSANFIGVYHMNDNTTNAQKRITLVDSAAYNNLTTNWTAVGGDVPGKDNCPLTTSGTGYAINFTGGCQFASNTANGFGLFNASRTMSVWTVPYSFAASSGLAGYFDITATRTATIKIDNSPILRLWNFGTDLLFTNNESTGLAYIAMNKTDYSLNWTAFNGTVYSGAGPTSMTAGDATYGVSIGGIFNYNAVLTGQAITDVRFRNTSSGGDWLLAEYKQTASVGDVVAYSSLPFSGGNGTGIGVCSPTRYSIVGANFTVQAAGEIQTCQTNTNGLYGVTKDVVTNYVSGCSNGGVYIETNKLNIKTCATGNPATATSTTNITLPISGNYTWTTSSNCDSLTLTINGTAFNTVSGNITELNATHYQLKGSATVNLPKNTTFPVVISCGSSSGGARTATVSFQTWNNSVNRIFSPTDYMSQYITSASDAEYISWYNAEVLHSDFKTGGNAPNVSNYCRLLLYFNNPYYGNVQLIPKITYFPGISAFPEFINSSDNSAYMLNNTIGYIFDSVTSSWYIVPAYICSSYSVVGSTVTLQYNPTGIAGGNGGTAPLQISLGGSCTYTNSSRQISCSATDSSNSLTSMTLSAYKQGNTTTACSSSGAGASMTLTCTLPNEAGTYSYIFYGTDAQGFNYALSSNVITELESAGTVGYGRAGWLALLMIFVVCAMLAATSIALSMALGVFAIFVGMGIGLIPVTGNITVAILLAVVGFAIAYKLKV